MTNVHQHILDVLRDQAARDVEDEQYRREVRAKFDRQEREMTAFLRRHAKRSDGSHYAEWLYGYLKQGGKITHAFPFAMPTEQVYVLQKSGELPPGFGALSVLIVVPEGLTLTEESRSHNGVYWMDGFRTTRDMIPLYPDITKRLLEKEAP